MYLPPFPEKALKRENKIKIPKWQMKWNDKYVQFFFQYDNFILIKYW